ncbi:hypothetical protein [Pseudaestuariivita atlantica]|nr:hypothetical protein [Pseudaestuariivita atlantica]
MTPRKTLLLIAAFVAITFGSFVLYLVRAISASQDAALIPLAIGGVA